MKGTEGYEKAKWLAVVFLILLIVMLTSCARGTRVSVDRIAVTQAQRTFCPKESETGKEKKESINLFSKSEEFVIDTSDLSKGLVTVSGVGKDGESYRFIMAHGDDVVAHRLDANGEEEVFPLIFGDGEYDFRIVRMLSRGLGTRITNERVNVTIKDEMYRFVNPNKFANYSPKMVSIRAANEIKEMYESDKDQLLAVMKYIDERVEYDDDKAESISAQSVYVPNPEETLHDEKGICIDYASLAASMLRSIGIPTKIVVGTYDSKDGTVAHAWNAVFLKADGWVYVDLSGSGTTYIQKELSSRYTAKRYY